MPNILLNQLRRIWDATEELLVCDELGTELFLHCRQNDVEVDNVFGQSETPERDEDERSKAVV
jgi:hypothetical protein